MLRPSLVLPVPVPVLMLVLASLSLGTGCELVSPECARNDDCGDDEECVDGTCEASERENECDADTDCDVGAGENCNDNTCAFRAQPGLLDVLFVVDNSGSMLEEHADVAAAFPSFVAALEAADVDWRVGVITTDVGLCDNRIPDAQGGPAWGFRPQRGCLHGDGPPDLESQRFISFGDAVDIDAWFASTIENVGVFGTPFERGLDAIEVFLDVDARRGPGCDEDLLRFRRAGARLLAVVITDEDDCSHRDGDAGFTNENEGEVCGEFVEHFTQASPSSCYDAPETLADPSTYNFGAGTRLAIVGGALGAPGSATAAGCLTAIDGDAVGGCFESGGLSNFTGPGQACAPDTAADRGGLDCCLADAATRYAGVGGVFMQSICGVISLDALAAVATVD